MSNYIIFFVCVFLFVFAVHVWLLRSWQPQVVVAQTLSFETEIFSDEELVK